MYVYRSVRSCGVRVAPSVPIGCRKGAKQKLKLYIFKICSPPTLNSVRWRNGSALAYGSSDTWASKRLCVRIASGSSFLLIHCQTQFFTTSTNQYHSFMLGPLTFTQQLFTPVCHSAWVSTLARAIVLSSVVMVFYFISTVVSPAAYIYVGRDKFESMLSCS